MSDLLKLAKGIRLDRDQIERVITQDHGIYHGTPTYWEVLRELGHPQGVPAGVRIDAKTVLEALGH